ncbi:hypothetical protein V1522DRAFT_379399 [Lipomyces starkeyi]
MTRHSRHMSRARWHWAPPPRAVIVNGRVDPIRRRCNVARPRAAACVDVRTGKVSFCADANTDAVADADAVPLCVPVPVSVPDILLIGAALVEVLSPATCHLATSYVYIYIYIYISTVLTRPVQFLFPSSRVTIYFCPTSAYHRYYSTMIARSSVIFAAIAALVSAQTPPSCASSCITGSMSSSDCQSVNIECLCTSQSYIDAVTSCVQSTCASSDFDAALAYAQSLCSGAGVTLSIDTATLSEVAQASDASSGSASTSVEASTTASGSASAAASSTASSATESSSVSSAAASSSSTSSGAESSSTLATSTTSGGTSSSSAASTTSSAASTSTGAAAAKFDPISVSFACIGAVVVSFIAGVASFGF